MVVEPGLQRFYRVLPSFFFKAASEQFFIFVLRCRNVPFAVLFLFLEHPTTAAPLSRAWKNPVKPGKTR